MNAGATFFLPAEHAQIGLRSFLPSLDGSLRLNSATMLIPDDSSHLIRYIRHPGACRND